MVFRSARNSVLERPRRNRPSDRIDDKRAVRRDREFQGLQRLQRRPCSFAELDFRNEMQTSIVTRSGGADESRIGGVASEDCAC
jgi:hypothetical protein